MAKWEELPLADRAKYMQLAVKNGYRDIQTIREAYNEYATGGEIKENGNAGKGTPEEGKKKIGPTYNPETKKWTNSKGQDITGMSFDSKWGTTTYLPSGAVDLYNGIGRENEGHHYRYASNAKRVYIGGNKNEVRQKYYDTDAEFTTKVKQVAQQYGIRPEVLASRLAEEGPVDYNVRHYNNTNGYYNRGDMYGPSWGLDDLGYMIEEGIVNQPKSIKDLDTEMFFVNEHGRLCQSVGSENYFDGVVLTAAALQYFRSKMKEKFPKASEALLDRYATAAFNMGITGATRAINAGNLGTKYDPYIKLKAYGG